MIARARAVPCPKPHARISAHAQIQRLRRRQQFQRDHLLAVRHDLPRGARAAPIARGIEFLFIGRGGDRIDHVGMRQRLVMDTSQAAVYCVIIRPLSICPARPDIACRPSLVALSSRRARRRSLIEAISAAAIFRKFIAKASGSP